jgi:hypothetical protein
MSAGNHALQDVEGCLRINKEEQLPGHITVRFAGFSFDPRDGSDGWCVVPGELTKNPLSSKASAQTVSLQVVTSSARGTFVLDFTFAGKDAVETRDRVQDALVHFLAPPMRPCPQEQSKQACTTMQATIAGNEQGALKDGQGIFTRMHRPASIRWIGPAMWWLRVATTTPFAQ